MAVKATASITLSFMVDAKAWYKFYKLQLSTAAKPSVPTTKPTTVPSGWTDAEPSYSNGSTNTLYVVECTLFTNDTFVYTPVSKSSSYEAAKEAYNLAVAAGEAVENIEVGGRNLFYQESYPERSTEEEIRLNDYNGVGSFTQFTNCLTFDPSSTIGETYTVSFWAKSPNGQTPLRVYNRNGDPRYFYFNVTLLSDLSNEWRYCTYTFVNTDRGSTYTTTDNRIEIYAPNQLGVLVKNIKIEKGNKPTDWTPAPEYVEAEFTGVREDLANANTDIGTVREALMTLDEKFSTIVIDENGLTILEQTGEGFVFKSKDIQDAVSTVQNGLGSLSSAVGSPGENGENGTGIFGDIDGLTGRLSSYENRIEFTTYEDEPCIKLVAKNEDTDEEGRFKLLITNTRIMFSDNDVVVAYITNESMYIEKAIIKQELHQGSFIWKARSNGNLGLIWKGE